jgi:hypothetical protein
MDSRANKATQDQILQFMTTEHFTLQTARAATVAEANGRSTLYLGSVSSAVVALAFVGQVSGMSEPFFLFGLVLFPSLFFLGIVTFARVQQTGLEDAIHALEINRIRHYYVEVAPETARYFLHSTHDDVAGFFHDMGATPSWLQYFLTTSGVVGIINSVIAGVFAGMLLRFALSIPAYLDAGLGIAVFVVSVVAHSRYQSIKSMELVKKLESLFPGKP